MELFMHIQLPLAFIFIPVGFKHSNKVHLKMLSQFQVKVVYYLFSDRQIGIACASSVTVGLIFTVVSTSPVLSR